MKSDVLLHLLNTGNVADAFATFARTMLMIPIFLSDRHKSSPTNPTEWDRTVWDLESRQKYIFLWIAYGLTSGLDLLFYDNQIFDFIGISLCILSLYYASSSVTAINLQSLRLKLASRATNIFPEDIAANLHKLYERKQQQNISRWQVHIELAYEVITLIFAMQVLVRIENLWLPHQKRIDE